SIQGNLPSVQGSTSAATGAGMPGGKNVISLESWIKNPNRRPSSVRFLHFKREIIVPRWSSARSENPEDYPCRVGIDSTGDFCRAPLAVDNWTIIHVIKEAACFATFHTHPQLTARACGSAQLSSEAKLRPTDQHGINRLPHGCKRSAGFHNRHGPMCSLTCVN